MEDPAGAEESDMVVPPKKEKPEEDHNIY